MVLERDEFKRANVQAFVENVPNTNDYRLASAFPDERVYDDQFIYNILKGVPKVAAKITGFNSSAPIRGMAQAEQAMGELTKIQDAYYIDEKTDRRISMPRQGTDEREMAIESVFKDVGNITVGIDDIVEYLRAKLVYDGVVEYTDVSTETKINFSVERPEGNNITLADKWDSDTSNPLQDLKDAVKQYQTATNSKRKPERIDIAQDVEEALLDHPKVKEMVYGSADDARMVDSGQLQTLFTRHGLPQYYVNTDMTTFEDIQDGKRVFVTEDHLTSGKVVLYDNVMGLTARGMVKTKQGGYAFGKQVDTIIGNDPPDEKIIVAEAAIPALKAVNNNVIMEVL